MTLKPQDIIVLAAIFLKGRDSWTIQSIARGVGMSPSEVHAALKRSTDARLYNPDLRRVLVSAFEEFLIHGIKYAFPPRRGGMARGIPTSYAAPPLREKLVHIPTEPEPVWPCPEGTSRGFEFAPLYPSVPRAAMADHNLYEFLALIDALRSGSARVVGLAETEIRECLKST